MRTVFSELTVWYFTAIPQDSKSKRSVRKIGGRSFRCRWYNTAGKENGRSGKSEVGPFVVDDIRQQKKRSVWKIGGRSFRYRWHKTAERKGRSGKSAVGPFVVDDIRRQNEKVGLENRRSVLSCVFHDTMTWQHKDKNSEGSFGGVFVFRRWHNDMTT